MEKRKPREHDIKEQGQGCEGCGICVAFCPQSVLELDERENGVTMRLEDCICRRLCEMHRPYLTPGQLAWDQKP